MSGDPSDVRLASKSIAGRRAYQEDAVATRTLSDGRTLMAIADGMGGHAAGEVASALALETLLGEVEKGASLDEAFRLANKAVNAKAQEPGKLGMGTTMVAVLLEGGEYRIANVGDSRAYLLTASGIRQISEDHSYVAEAMKRGQSEKEALNSQWRNALTRSIGTDIDVIVDLFGPFPVEPDTALILCSDGLYKSLSDEDLRRVFRRSAGPESAAQALVASAFEAGSDDNITVALAEFGDVERDGGTLPPGFPSVAPEEPESPGVDEASGDDEDRGSWWQVWKK
jgi:serine/threonine protein phosphatase PrpC